MKIGTFLFLGVLSLFSATTASAELLSAADRQAYRAAFGAAQASEWPAARQLAAGASEPLPAKILRWLELLRSDRAQFADIVAFADANPDWPRLDALRDHAEQVMDNVSDAEVRAYFESRRPVSPRGKLRWAGILAGSGQQEAADTLIREMWRTPDLDPDTEQRILDRYADALRPQDHAQRLDRLLWAGQASAARREMARASADWRAVAEARLAFADLRDDAETALAAVPETLRNDAGLSLDHARWLRRKDRLEDAAEILRRRPVDLVRPAAWWREREIVVRGLLDERKDQLAYALAAWRGLGETGTALTEAEFLSGWIALRRLAEPKAAYDHFSALYENATIPASRSRGAFWMARAAEAMGSPEVARRWLAVAAAQGTTYYGQIAAASLHSAVQVQFPPEPQPSEPDVEAFDRLELVRAARMLAEIGQDDLAKLFLVKVAAGAKTAIEQKLVATLAEGIGALDVGVAAAKRAGRDDVPLLAEGYPLLRFQQKAGVEPSLVLAIARQESGFDTEAVSRAGARGLMQLTPQTAREIGRSLGMPFSAARLLSDPAYNLTLGQAFVDRLLNRFAGSYVLAAAAYNAGPARVKQWLDTLGDPRAAAVDPVDWVESIPYPETRNYVQRVLENLQVYRLRLGTAERPFTLAADLRR